VQNDDDPQYETSLNKQENNKTNPLFSEDEIREIVKSFLITWLSNDVKILFPEPEEIETIAKLENRQSDTKTILLEHSKIKEKFINVIYIFTGRTKATQEQQNKAIYDLFNLLLHYRSGNRIEGNFLRNMYEERLSRIERNVKDLNKNFEELYFYIKSKFSDDSQLKGR
jgi:hypothetical protein